MNYKSILHEYGWTKKQIQEQYLNLLNVFDFNKDLNNLIEESSKLLVYKIKDCLYLYCNKDYYDVLVLYNSNERKEINILQSWLIKPYELTKRRI